MSEALDMSEASFFLLYFKSHDSEDLAVITSTIHEDDRGYESVGSDLKPEYAGVTDGSAVTKCLTCH